MSQYSFTLKLLDRMSNIMDEPGESYVKKTLNMMEFLLVQREEITDRQTSIINEICFQCEEFQSKKGEKM